MNGEIRILIRATEQEQALIEEKMKQILIINLSVYAQKMLIDGYIILLDTLEIKAHTAQFQKIVFFYTPFEECRSKQFPYMAKRFLLIYLITF